MNQTSEINADMARRLRALRLRAHLSMRELGRRAGVAVSYVSNLEAGKVSATIATLRKLLLALDSDIGPFFSDSQPAPDGFVFRRRQMRSANDGGRSYTFVLPSRKDILIEMLDEELFAGEKPEFELQQGDLAGYVISGELILEIKGEREAYRLQAGDAFYVSAGRWARGSCGKGDSVRLITSELLSSKKIEPDVRSRTARARARKQNAL